MQFTIKDLESLSGVKAHTIRIWEQRYNLLKPSRTATNIRYYENEELKNFLNIVLLNNNGFKISQINKLNATEINNKILQLHTIEAIVEVNITQLIQFMIDYDSVAFENKIDIFIAKQGLKNAITLLVYPFLERIGILWQTNNINPIQEHLVTNIIRQKLITATDACKSLNISSKKAILFLPETEFHELSLLYVNYLLKIQEINTIYLGCNVPIGELAELIKRTNPIFLYTHITAIQNKNGAQKLIDNCVKVIPNKISIIISGNIAKFETCILPANVKFKKSLLEVVNFINDL